MDGKSHLAVGLMSSALTLTIIDIPTKALLVPMIVGGISSLAPDLDHKNSTLTNKLSNPMRVIMTIVIVLLTVCISHYLDQNYSDQYEFVGYAIGALVLLLFHIFFRPKMLLFLTGAALTAGGIFYLPHHKWLILLGAFIMTASLLKHRGLTHSLYFLIFWSLICFMAENKLKIEGIWLTGSIGYLSHLLTDHWFTRTKIKWIKTKEVLWIYNKLKNIR
jgi:inner membrane protein